MDAEAKPAHDNNSENRRHLSAYDAWAWCVHIFSAEWLLDGRPNGGDVIVTRSLIVATWAFTLALLLYNAFDPTRTCFFTDRPCAFSFRELFTQLVTHFGWFVTIFAAVYIALYARFASQWTYLADLYNRIKGAEVRMSRDWGNRKLSETLASWKAAFLEDADALHLATKGTFVAAVLHWGNDERVAQLFAESTYNGQKRLDELLSRATDAYERHASKQ